MRHFIFFTLLFYFMNLPVLAGTVERFGELSLDSLNAEQVLGSDFEDIVVKKMKAADIVGLSLAIVGPKGLVYAKSFGYEDKANKVPVTEKSVFRIGELSELMTASLVLQLVERGKLILEDPVEKYLPELNISSFQQNSFKQKLKIRHLLAHYSGLPSYVPKNSWGRQVPTVTEIIAQLNQDHFAFSPGQTYQYSSINYLLLGHIVEKVSGQSLDAYAQENLFRPLNMENSSFDFERALQNQVSRGYRNGKNYQLLPTRDYPNDGMFSSIKDLSHWLQLLINQEASQGPVLKKSSITEMLRPQFLDSVYNFELEKGLGWKLDSELMDLKGVGRVAWQAGEMPQFQSRLIFLPDQKLAAVLLSNTKVDKHKGNEKLSLGKILVEGLQRVLKKRDIALQKENVSPLPPKIKNLTKDLSSWSGDYLTPGMGVFQLKIQDGKVIAKLKGVPASALLVPREENLFSLELKVLGLLKVKPKALQRYLFSFKEINEQKILLLHDYNKSPTKKYFTAQKISLKPLDVLWQKRTGNFRRIELSDHWLKHKHKNNQLKIVLKENKLFAKFDKFLYPIIPQNGQEALLMNALLERGIKLKWIKKNGKEYLRYAGVLYEKK